VIFLPPERSEPASVASVASGLDTKTSSSTYIRLALHIVLAAAIVALPSCGDPHGRLRARLATFPAPTHLALVHQEETGPSSCSPGGGCPTVARYYLSERSLDVTCRDVRSAVDGWDVQPIEWDMDPEVFNACLGSRQGLSVSVFDADRLPALTSAEIDPSELRRSRSAVLISLMAV
jgi:hypothetical protein